MAPVIKIPIILPLKIEVFLVGVVKRRPRPFGCRASSRVGAPITTINITKVMVNPIDVWEKPVARVFSPLTSEALRLVDLMVTGGVSQALSETSKVFVQVFSS